MCRSEEPCRARGTAWGDLARPHAGCGPRRRLTGRQAAQGPGVSPWGACVEVGAGAAAWGHHTFPPSRVISLIARPIPAACRRQPGVPAGWGAGHAVACGGPRWLADGRSPKRAYPGAPRLAVTRVPSTHSGDSCLRRDHVVGVTPSGPSKSHSIMSLFGHQARRRPR